MKQEKSSDSSETPLVKETPLEAGKEQKKAVLSCWILYLHLRYFEPFFFFFLLGSPGLHADTLT